MLTEENGESIGVDVVKDAMRHGSGVLIVVVCIPYSNLRVHSVQRKPSSVNGLGHTLA